MRGPKEGEGDTPTADAIGFTPDYITIPEGDTPTANAAGFTPDYITIPEGATGAPNCDYDKPATATAPAAPALSNLDYVEADPGGGVAAPAVGMAGAAERAYVGLFALVAALRKECTSEVSNIYNARVHKPMPPPDLPYGAARGALLSAVRVSISVGDGDVANTIVDRIISSQLFSVRHFFNSFCAQLLLSFDPSTT